MLTLHAWNPLIENSQPALSFTLLTSLQWGLGYQEKEICGTGVGQPATTPVSYLDVLSFHTSSSVLWSQSRSTPNSGVRKTETSRQVELCYLISSSLHLWFGWCRNLGQLSVCSSTHGQGRKRGKGIRESSAVSVLFWSLFGVLIEVWAWWVCS